nr:hypothetical protein [uncultured Acidocella sp.]
MSDRPTSRKGLARIAFFRHWPEILAAIENNGELPKLVWRRLYGTGAPPAISYSQFMRLLAEGPQRPSKKTKVPAVAPSTTLAPNPERKPLHGQTARRTSCKFGNLKIDLNEAFGVDPPEKGE